MKHLEDNLYAIVADIGGTFARFGRVNLDNLHVDRIEIYSCAEFITFETALLTYQAQNSLQAIKHIAIAIACPVMNDLVCMTNNHWRFSIQDVQNRLGLSKLKVMNDFTAIAMSLPALKPHEQTQIGKGHLDVHKPRVVLGAGTGLGVAYLIPNPHGYKAYAGEGGHVSWGAQNEQEWFIYSYLKNNYMHVSYERLLSGQGLENLYQAIAAYHHQKVASKSAAQIITLALNNECTIAKATIEQFFATMGGYAGDLALTFGALGGVYIAGGIAPRLLSLISHTEFRSRFEDKGRFGVFNALIPTYIITAAQPGILGAAVCLKQSLIGVSDVTY